ncbi:radical SAM protein [uncultured Desulfobulbus sp.]|uniref:radical SAM protein n=1 Tax=uncultured Desulfobulbus sp. TaxID=239745 RepID=UPI0029C7E4E9|nr:radical SAM protein [uncultured Desulfobulbus sp.]
MDYQGDIIRPPSEAFSLILQVTTGCSHNRCTFCGAYRNKPFQIKPWKQIEADLDFAATWCGRHTTLFLADGDALALPHALLTTLLLRIREKLPWIRRVSSYATCQNIMVKSDEQLRCYKQWGLSRLYMGLESGHDPTLTAIAKGVDSEAMITAGQLVRAAGIFLSVTCLLGIAGATLSQEHAQATAEVLSRMQPHQIAVLTLMPLENTPLYRQIRAGRFILPNPVQLFEELRRLLADLAPFRTQFHANHASNYFALSGRLPKDKDVMLATIDQALAGLVPLKPEPCRGL